MKFKNARTALRADLQPGAQFGYVVTAEVGYENDWAAYRGPVDWTPEKVAYEGDKLNKAAAEALFPVMKAAGLRYRE
jgi:hypothetical protein